MKETLIQKSGRAGITLALSENFSSVIARFPNWENVSEIYQKTMYGKI
jgi:hypothetical protein